MISVIVPVYNVEDYLERCVDSLVKQDIDEEYEIVLVDDGAKDRSGELCDELAEKYENVKALHKKNGGLSSARNYGIAYSGGELIAFVDSDDYVTASYLKHMYDLLKKFDADMAITCTTLRYSEEPFKNDRRFQDYCATPKEAFIEVYAGEYANWTACGKLYKREILTNKAFPKGYHEDIASMYKFIDRCSKVAIGDYCNDYYYIQREGSITFSEFSKKHMRIFQVCDELSEYIDKTYPDLDYISVKVCQHSVQMLLSRLNLTPKQYRFVFNRYKKLFRDNLVSILKNKDYEKKSKVYLAVLCTNPAIYKLFNKCVRLSKKQK